MMTIVSHSFQHAKTSGSVEDIWIAVMGVTGAGKSSFIQLCTGNKGPGIIGHGLVGCKCQRKKVKSNKYDIKY